MGTSHELGQNFAKAFDIEFLAPDGQREYAWQTSWGSSTRMVGGLIMAHGDDNGLRVPPRLAPIQVAVIVVKDATATEAAARLRRRAAASGASGSSWTTGPTCRSAAAPSTGSSRACRCGSRSARATWPTDRVTLVRRIAGGKTPTPLGRRARRRPDRRSSRTRSRCTTRPSGAGTRGSPT